MITYVSGGLLGDFIHQLSVVNEEFLKTGEKGRVLLSSTHGDPFRLGPERAYRDLKDIVLRQNYVDSFELYDGKEAFDVNLSSWRRSPLLYQVNWAEIFGAEYGVEWGEHRWLALNPAPEYEGATLVGITGTRRPAVDWSFLRSLPPPVFFFADNTVDTLSQFYSAISGCRLFVGNLSSPLAAAFAMHKKCICLHDNGLDAAHVEGLEKLWPHFSSKNAP